MINGHKVHKHAEVIGRISGVIEQGKDLEVSVERLSPLDQISDFEKIRDSTAHHSKLRLNFTPRFTDRQSRLESCISNLI